jgi:hypothetical protein
VNEEKNSDGVSIDTDLSIFRGGLFYRVQRATRVIHPDHWNLGRRVTLAIAIAWVPLVLLTILFNIGGLVSLLRDYRVYSRLLIAIPILIVGQPFMDSRFRAAVRHIHDADLLKASDWPRLEEAKKMLLRLRDSAIPELLILALLIAHTVTSEKSLVDATPWLAHQAGSSITLTPAGWYAVLVSATLFQFLLGLGVWKWMLWTFFAFKLSRLGLRLFPTHPDEHGGLGFLGLTPISFVPVIIAANCAIGSEWRHEILAGRASLNAFQLPGVVLLVIIFVIAFGPLVFFVPRLAVLRRRGMAEYGTLGQLHSMDFHEKWIEHRAGHEAEFLTAPESSTLADFGHAYQALKDLKPLPADLGTLKSVAIAAVVPMLPVIVAVMPLKVVLQMLLKSLG